MASVASLASDPFAKEDKGEYGGGRRLYGGGGGVDSIVKARVLFALRSFFTGEMGVESEASSLSASVQLEAADVGDDGDGGSRSSTTADAEVEIEVVADEVSMDNVACAGC
jgi:hypothetical protein